jgi:hypothetical protein
LFFLCVFLLASRAAQKKGQTRGRAHTGSCTRRRQQRLRRRLVAGIQQGGAPILISCAFTEAAKVPGVNVHLKHI